MLFVLLLTCSFSYADEFRSKSCVFYICSGRFRTKAFTDSVYISRVTPGIIRGTYISQRVGLKCRHQMNYDNQLRYRPGELLCTSMSDFTISPHRCFLMRNLPVYRNTFHWELSPQWTSETTKREKVPPPKEKWKKWKMSLKQDVELCKTLGSTVKYPFIHITLRNTVSRFHTVKHWIKSPSSCSWTNFVTKPDYTNHSPLPITAAVQPPYTNSIY